MVEFAAALLIGFTFGFGVREIISRRRRAEARRRQMSDNQF